MRVLSPRGCCWKECVFARSPLVVPAPARVRARVSVCMCMCARICAGVCARAPRAACALDVGAACGLQVHASRARASSERHARQGHRATGGSRSGGSRTSSASPVGWCAGIESGRSARLVGYCAPGLLRQQPSARRPITHGFHKRMAPTLQAAEPRTRCPSTTPAAGRMLPIGAARRCQREWNSRSDRARPRATRPGGRPHSTDQRVCRRGRTARYPSSVAPTSPTSPRETPLLPTSCCTSSQCSCPSARVPVTESRSSCLHI
jgi:hypothetical protein